MVDKAKIEQAVRLLLEGIGEDITREGLIDTDVYKRQLWIASGQRSQPVIWN